MRHDCAISHLETLSFAINLPTRTYGFSTCCPQMDDTTVPNVCHVGSLERAAAPGLLRLSPREPSLNGSLHSRLLSS
jgi:hypothetical protein